MSIQTSTIPWQQQLHIPVVRNEFQIQHSLFARKDLRLSGVPHLYKLHRHLSSSLKMPGPVSLQHQMISQNNQKYNWWTVKTLLPISPLTPKSFTKKKQFIFSVYVSHPPSFLFSHLTRVVLCSQKDHSSWSTDHCTEWSRNSPIKSYN